jgi:hypothetical protein
MSVTISSEPANIPSPLCTDEVERVTILIDGEVHTTAYIYKEKRPFVQQGKYIQFQELTFSSDSSGKHSRIEELTVVFVGSLEAAKSISRFGYNVD